MLYKYNIFNQEEAASLEGGGAVLIKSEVFFRF